MDRRLLGIGVLVLAMLAATMPAVLDGRRVVGTAGRVPTPGVGDCVLTAAPPWPAEDIWSSMESFAGRPTGRLASCDEPGTSGVIAQLDVLPLADPMTRGQYSQLKAALCGPAVQAASDRFQRGSFSWQGGGRRIEMKLQLGLSGELATPTPSAIAAGQRWTVCYATAVSATGTVPIELGSDQPSDLLGMCFNDAQAHEQDRSLPDTSPVWITCREPHTTQHIGFAWAVAGKPGAADFRLACREFLVQVTGRPDPTAGGQLRLSIDPVKGVSYTPIDCGLTVTDRSRTLSGSLIGIGNRLLPWS